jgi:hypothetical protein
MYLGRRGEQYSYQHKTCQLPVKQPSSVEIELGRFLPTDTASGQLVSAREKSVSRSENLGRKLA